jgi:hypothetical protein
MDPLMRVLVQAAQWLRRPPSAAHVRILVVALLGCLGIVAIERFVGWPDWARADRTVIVPVPR